MRNPTTAAKAALNNAQGKRPAVDRPATTYAHMCRDGHVQIGHNNSSDDEMCPLCLANAEINILRSAVYKIQSPDNIGKYPDYLDAQEKASIRRAVASGLS